jgi:3-hydroxyacyl-CoA dehydrogenase/enoyl-CoA hydratase/3-hydroxybutyryl-CoA epimerase
MEQVSYEHWRCERDKENIAWLTFDRKGTKTNTLNSEVFEELLAILQRLQKDNQPLGLVIQSGKKNGFIAGADVQQFKNLTSTDVVFQLIREGQMVFNHLAELPFPTLAVIEGFCVGGGFELALACSYRLAIDIPKTAIGLPEVNLGIHPGWGGSIRLPRLVGGLKAMDLILSGRRVDAKTAARLGIVDSCVPKRQQMTAIMHYIKNKPMKRKPTLLERFSQLHWVRPLLAKWLEKKLVKKVNRSHYPAPYVALAQWVQNDVEDDISFMHEAKSIAQLMLSDTARHLVRVFGLQDHLKSLSKSTTDALKHIHVLGAGVMGGDIAAWCALKGYRVTLQDTNEAAMATAFKRAAILFSQKLKAPYLITAAKDRLIPDVQGAGILQADLIIEAVIEKLEVKKSVFEMLAKTAKKDALIATNTSTIPLSELSDNHALQARLIGLHFFNPVAKMPLVEVIRSEKTEAHCVERGMSFVRSLEKLPLPVKSSPGFLVNRILMPYLIESMLLVEAGVPVNAIDTAAVEFGMPMGPIELADTVGLDVCLYGIESLSHYFGGSIPQTLRLMVEQGTLGKKTGEGFYQYKNNQKVVDKIKVDYQFPSDGLDRLILCMLNEAVACLREQVVENFDDLDAGMIFGTGFPPFRGGLMSYLVDQGASLILQRLKTLSECYGERFTPDEGWKTLNILDTDSGKVDIVTVD